MRVPDQEEVEIAVMNLIEAYGPSIAPGGFLSDRGSRTRGMSALLIPTGGAVDLTRSASTSSAS